MGKIVHERKAADPLLTGLLLLMRFSVFAVKLFSGDSTGGASTLASAAANTCVRNLVCHNKTLLLSPVH